MRKLLGRLGRWLASFDPSPAVIAPPPFYWVGITRYEGDDPMAAEAAFLVLRDESERIPGAVEWMNGTQKVRSFKVV